MYQWQLDLIIRKERRERLFSGALALMVALIVIGLGYLAMYIIYLIGAAIYLPA